MFLGGFFSILLLLGIAMVVVWLISNSDGLPVRPQSSSGHDETPLEILKKRYARGEINRDQFEQIKEDLVEGRRHS